MENELTKINDKIYTIRGQKVMFDSDLAELYEVETRILNQAVKRNIDKFPRLFMFQLTADEWEDLRSQFVIFKNDTRKFKPYVFTEHGILMLSSILKSDKAINVNIRIMRIFVQMRKYTISQSDTSAQIAELRKLLMLHIENSDQKFSEHDKEIQLIIQALNNLLEKPKPAKRIGFNADKS